MNLEGIPKSFWHSASFTLVAFTIGFLFISYKYGDLTIKFKELEVRTTNTTSLEESLSTQELILQTRNETIKAREKEINDLTVILENKAGELEKVKNELANLQAENNSEATKAVISKLNDIYKDGEFEDNYKSKKEALVTLQKKQQQQVESYNNQRDIYKMQQQQQQQWTQ